MFHEHIYLMEYFGSIFESGDIISDGHCRRVRRYSEFLLDKVMQFFPEYGLTAEDKEKISFAAVSHDVGKIGVPDWILQKPSCLTYEEFEIAKSHTSKGRKMFEQLMAPLKRESKLYARYKCCADVCMSHHERYDGEGYPEGLKGDEIPIAAQIVGLADAYDVLINERIYKLAYDKADAFEMIIEGECGMFSPKLLQIFQMYRMELENIYN